MGSEANVTGVSAMVALEEAIDNFLLGVGEVQSIDVNLIRCGLEAMTVEVDDTTFASCMSELGWEKGRVLEKQDFISLRTCCVCVALCWVRFCCGDYFFKMGFCQCSFLIAPYSISTLTVHQLLFF